MMKYFFAAFILFLSIISVGCTDKDKQISMRVDALLGGFGLKSNVFQTEPEAQLGTIIFYRSKKIIEEIKKRFEFVGPSDTALQIQGRLAQKILEHISYFSKGTIKFDDQGVVYLFGEIADDLYKELKNFFTIDDIFYFEGKEMIVLSGTEASSFLEIIKNSWDSYYDQTPEKVERVFVTSYDTAAEMTKNFLTECYEDLDIAFETNPLVGAFYLTQDAGEVTLEGVGQVTLLTGELWVMSFDSVSRLGAFLTGGEAIPESVVLRKTVKLVGDTGYLAFYTLSEVFRRAAGVSSQSVGESSSLLVNPLIAIDIVSEALKNSTTTAETFREDTTDIVVGYISDNTELLGEYLNLLHENIVGDLF
ncbi:MAG: hypothetical protein HYY62_07090, partial [Deltaproteobacteria bacterium]|nr:hypothetical protein [Deltaproteobacteria bacterium]